MHECSYYLMIDVYLYYIIWSDSLSFKCCSLRTFVSLLDFWSYVLLV